MNPIQRLVAATSRQGQIALLVCTVLCTAIWVFTFNRIALDRERAISAQLVSNAVLAQTQEGRLSHALQVFDQILLVLRDDFASHGKPPSLNRRLKALQVDRTFVGNVTLMDASGHVIVTTTDDTKVNYADREYFKAHAADSTDRLLIGKPIIGRITGKSIVSLTRRLYHPDGAFAGVVFLALDPVFLAPRYSNVEIAKDTTITLVGLDGIVRVRQINGVNSFGEDVRSGPLLQQVQQAETGNLISVTPIDGRRRATSYRKLVNYPLVVLVGSPVEQVTDALKGNERVLYLSAVFGSLFLMALTFAFNRALTRNRQQLEQAQTNAERMRAIIDASPVPMALNDTAGRITFLNRSFVETYGYTLNEIPTLEKWWQCAYPDASYRDWVIKTWGEELQRAEKAGTPFAPMEIRVRCKDGSEKITVASAARYSPDADADHLVVLFDITQRQLAEQAIQTSLLEKEALLKEVHHRVKNNLQIISSLIRLETGRSQQPEVQSVLSDMQGRIRSMALLHESLYRGQSFAQIDLGQYIRQLAIQVFKANLSKNAPIELQLDIAPLPATLDQAIPCGLLANELITNALKHGFPSGQSGLVTVTLLPEQDPARWRFAVADNGVGLPDDFASRQQSSLGLQLASGLANQLGGEMSIGPGATFTVCFTVVKPAAAA